MKQKFIEVLEELLEQEQLGRREIKDGWYDEITTFLPAPEFQKKYRGMLRALKITYRELMKLKDADTIDAFVALGGHPNTSGEVESDLLRKNVKEFGLTIDIDKLISEADTDNSGLIDFSEFKEMFEADASETTATLQLPGSTPQKRFSIDHINPTTLPNYLTFSGKDTGIAIPHTHQNIYKQRKSISDHTVGIGSSFDIAADEDLVKTCKRPSEKRGKREINSSQKTIFSPQHKTGILVDPERRIPQWCFTRDLLKTVGDSSESLPKPLDHSLPRLPPQIPNNCSLAGVFQSDKNKEKNKLRRGKGLRAPKKAKKYSISKLPEFQCCTVPNWSVPEGLKRVRPSTSNSLMGGVHTQSIWKDLKLQSKIHSQRLCSEYPVPDIVPYRPPLKFLLSKQRWGII